jgi:hypothetical protein
MTPLEVPLLEVLMLKAPLLEAPLLEVPPLKSVTLGVRAEGDSAVT